MCRILNKATWQIIECTNHTSLDSQSKDIVICLESDYIIESKLTNTNTNTNTNTENIMSVLPTTTISLLERSKLALQQHKEGLELIDKLDALNAQINEAEIKLEVHINSVEIINVQEIKDQIEERSEYLEELNNELSKYESKHLLSKMEAKESTTQSINSSIETLENSFSIPYMEEECEINEEYFTDREINLDNLTTEFKNLVKGFQIKTDGKLGSYPQEEILRYLKSNSEWCYYRSEEILKFLNSTGKIYPNYIADIKAAIPTEWKDEYMPF
jgi:hypothetical protein